jgi:LPPG:FO 2-phospho-L-lactate transferase
MSDDRLETHVVVDGEEPGTRRAIHFQEWWIRFRASLPAHDIVLVGVDDALPAPGVLEAISDADVVLLPPSNPVVSIGTILQVPGLRDAVRSTAAPVVGVSPIVGGAPVRGMADACLAAIGVETSAGAVARHYGARSAGGVIDGWLVHDESDADAVDALAPLGIAARAVPLLMTDLEATAAIAAEALALAESVRG